MGALAPILYQGAIPVFADVDPRTGNVTAETIADRLSDRTKAIVVTHLFGNPCEMGEIMALAAKHTLPVIEDCAQAYLATSGGRKVGTIGAIGCFSLQQGKHITAGEGGLVVTNDDDLARRVRLFIDKAWGYGDPNPDHYFLALNYRMSELQGAVALAQLGKLEQSVSRRIDMAARLTHALAGLPGIETPWVHADNRHVFWRYVLRVDRDSDPGRACCARCSPERLRRRIRPALHPEAGVSLRHFRRAAHLRIQPIPVHAGPARSDRLLRGAVPGHVRGAGSDARAALERALRAAPCRLPGRGHHQGRGKPGRSTDVTERVAFGLIGAGGIAQSYLQVFSGLEEARITAVADVRLDAAASAAEAMGCHAFGSWEELADRATLDAVLICTPPATHAEIAMHFLEKGIAVLCEKPFAVDLATARELAAASAANHARC